MVDREFGLIVVRCFVFMFFVGTLLILFDNFGGDGRPRGKYGPEIGSPGGGPVNPQTFKIYR